MTLRFGGIWVLAVTAALSVVAGNALGHRTDPLGLRTVALGRSTDGREIDAVETGDFDSPDKVLVVGCIHGNECAGIAIALRVAHLQASSQVDLWIVPDLNPDGAQADTRGNAHGVDLNRNFRHLAGVFYSGPHPLSEPESRIAYRLISRLRPSISIWFHQHLDIVDESGGNLAIERRFAVLVGLRVRRLQREPGSVVGWENHRFASGTAFVVELPSGPLSVAATSRFARAVVTLAEPPRLPLRLHPSRRP